VIAGLAVPGHFAAGFGDNITGGLFDFALQQVHPGMPPPSSFGWSPTGAITDLTPAGRMIDRCNRWYKAGQWAGVAWSAAMAVSGAVSAAAESGPAMSVIESSAAAEAAEGAGPGSIPRITPGSLPAAEEASVLDSIGHIDAGTKPTGSTGIKWGSQFKNWNGDLPGPSGPSSPFREFRVAPEPGTQGAGPLRLVVSPSTGEVYYTWTHYGDAGNPAFVRIR
jgi:hypothetical protein